MVLRHKPGSEQRDHAENRADDLHLAWLPLIRLVGAEGGKPQDWSKEHEIDANVAVRVAEDTGRHVILVDCVEQP